MMIVQEEIEVEMKVLVMVIFHLVEVAVDAVVMVGIYLLLLVVAGTCFPNTLIDYRTGCDTQTFVGSR